MVKIVRRIFRLYKPVYHKVFKAERINALRKQYDSFIEEDKKRKDRNEYILERLDKIRTTSAIVQVRNVTKDYFATVNQNKFIHDRKNYIEKILPMYEKPKYSLKQVNNSNVVTSMDEEEFLNEIRKKFILIPRHILENEDNYFLKSNSDDNGDWRKKYTILEQLKQNEKEDKQEANLDLCKDFTTIIINDEELNYNKIEEPNYQTQFLLSDYDKNSSKTLQDNSGMIASLSKINTDTKIKRLQKLEDDTNHTNDSEYCKDLNRPIADGETKNLAQNTDSEKPTIPVIAPRPSRNYDIPNERDLAVTDHDTNDLTQKEKMQAECERELKPKDDIQLEKEQYLNINADSQNVTETSKSDNYQEDKGNIQRDSDILKDFNFEETLQPLAVHEPIPIENVNLTVSNIGQEEDNIQNQIVDNLIEENQIGENLIVDNLTVDNLTVDNQIVDNQIVDNQIVDSQIVDNQIVDNQIVENQIVENQIVENQIVDNQIVENQIVDNQIKENEILGNQIVENQIVEDQIGSEEVPTDTYINPAIQYLENIGQAAQIEEFEAEQINMFNSDPNVTEYSYDQAGNIINDDYENTVHRTQDESYAYYEGTPQVHPGEINDHLESTEQYDPHYEAQYTAYEQQDQLIDQQYSDYKEESITQPQMYEQVQFEVPDHNVVDDVEKELDIEQNYYTSIKPPNPGDEINNIIDESMLPEDEPVEKKPLLPPVS